VTQAHAQAQVAFPEMIESNAEQMLAAADARASELAAPGLSPTPRRQVAVLSCMDTRIDLFPMLGIERGDAHIIRNAGGLATDDAIRSLSVSQRLLGTNEVVVVMHDGCGLRGASEDDYGRALAADGARPSWRMGAFEDVEAALRDSLARLRSAAELPNRERIRGFVFDPETGVLREPGA
jgi:carbonic anhydrase